MSSRELRATLARGTGTRRGSSRAPARLEARAARPRRLPARDRRDVLRERGTEGAIRPRARARLGARRGLGPRGGRARRPARRAVGALRAGRRACVAKLLGELEGVEDREAQYVSELVLLSPDGASCAARARSRGVSPSAPRGSEGFGYDPIFVPDGETARSRSSGTSGRRRTRTVPARPARCSTRSRPARSEATSSRAVASGTVAPVDARATTS